MVRSATDSAFFPGVVTTGMPRSPAAATSTFTGPPRAQHTRRRLGEASSTASVTAAPRTDQHLVVAEAGDHLGRRTRELPDTPLRLGVTDLIVVHVQLEIIDLVVAGDGQERLPDTSTGTYTSPTTRIFIRAGMS